MMLPTIGGLRVRVPSQECRDIWMRPDHTALTQLECPAGEDQWLQGSAIS